MDSGGAARLFTSSRAWRKQRLEQLLCLIVHASQRWGEDDDSGGAGHGSSALISAGIPAAVQGGCRKSHKRNAQKSPASSQPDAGRRELRFRLTSPCLARWRAVRPNVRCRKQWRGARGVGVERLPRFASWLLRALPFETWIPLLPSNLHPDPLVAAAAIGDFRRLPLAELHVSRRLFWAPLLHPLVLAAACMQGQRLAACFLQRFSLLVHHTALRVIRACMLSCVDPPSWASHYAEAGARKEQDCCSVPREIASARLAMLLIAASNARGGSSV